MVRWRGVAATLGALLWLPAAAAATTYTVRSTGDAVHGTCSSACTLRDAVIAANAHAGADVVVLGARTYRLSLAGADEDAAATGDLDISGPTTIVGAGAKRTTIDANRLDRAFDLVAATARLTLRGARIVRAAGSDGGCLRASTGGGLTLVDVVLDHCSATGNGAAIDVSTADALPVTLDRVAVVAPKAIGDGGVILLTSAPVVIRRSSITNGRAPRFAGLYRGGGTATTLDQVDIRGDRSTAGPDAAFWIQDGAGTTTFRRVRVIGNTATDSGGGGFIRAHAIRITDTEISGNVALAATALAVVGDTATATLTMERTTIAQNRAFGSGPGAGLVNESDLTATLRNVSIVGNGASGISVGGGVLTTAPLVLRNTTIAGNTAGQGSGIYTSSNVDAANSIVDGGCGIGGTTTSRGGNIDRGDSCGFTAATDRRMVDPLLDVLGAHGGFVRTIGLRKGSPAIDHALRAFCPAVDARGVRRPRDGNGDRRKVCDIGAFER